MIRLQEVVVWVKRLLEIWESGGADLEVKTARPCPCGHPFRHLHGRYTRFVIVGRVEFEISIPLLLCPCCGKTKAVLPSFLRFRSPYPWCYRQAVLLGWLMEGGYRKAAARFDMSWELLWQWVEELARIAKELVNSLLGLLLRYTEATVDLLILPQAREVEARARTPAKREGVGAIVPLMVAGYWLWQVGAGLGLPWGKPEPAEILALVDRVQTWLR